MSASSLCILLINEEEEEEIIKKKAKQNYKNDTYICLLFYSYIIMYCAHLTACSCHIKDEDSKITSSYFTKTFTI